MRLIHYTAADGWEACVFTTEQNAEPADFISQSDTSRPGFEATVFEADEWSPPSRFLAPDGDLMEKTA